MRYEFDAGSEAAAYRTVRFESATDLGAARKAAKLWKECLESTSAEPWRVNQAQLYRVDPQSDTRAALPIRNYNFPDRGKVN